MDAIVDLHVTTATKRRIAVGTLIVLALWIPFHHVATRWSGADPWRFFGWAMYAVPNATVTVQANPMRDDERVPILLSPHSLEILNVYGQRRAIWGRLVSPDSTANRILEHEDKFDGLEVMIRDWRVDTRTARWTFDQHVRLYRR